MNLSIHKMIHYSHLLLQQWSERRHSYYILMERHIQALWLEQKYFKELKTSTGEAIHIISPGIWNETAGPDFLKAHLYIGQKEYRGDVEIHLHEADWLHHGHHLDEKYQNVVLHLSFYQSHSSSELLKLNGERIEKAYLEPFLTVSPSHLVHLIDLDLYPYQKFLGSGRCAEQLFVHLSEEKLRSFLTSAAIWRLRQKKQHLASHFSSLSLQMAGGIAMALGYKLNSESFLTLFSLLLPFRDRDESDLLAMAMGCCGFFEEDFNLKWQQSSYYQSLQSVWRRSENLISHRISLKLGYTRPLNHPIRRLIYLVKLLRNLESEDIWMKLKEGWLESAKKGKITMKRWIDSLFNLIPSYQDEYWNSHYTFENQTRKMFLPLMGRDLKRDILVNTFLPLLHAELQESDHASMLPLFFRFYEGLEGSCAGKTRYLTHRFFGDEAKGTVLNKALFEQGAYQLHKDFCLHFEASCEGCPFVERYLSLESLS